MTKVLFTAYDQPEKRDYPFQDYDEFARSEEKVQKRPKDELKVQNQWWTPACTMYWATHIVNAMNIIEDKKLGLDRKQVDPADLWNQFCAERGNYVSWATIQSIAVWMKKKGYISGFVTIDNWAELSVIEKQVDQALAMWNFIYTGSRSGDWAKIKKTGIYSERADGKFVWHARDIVIERKEWDYYICLNSYGEERWPLKWYFKLHRNDLKKIYSKLILIDKDDSNLFGRFEEIQKVKQAVNLLRQVHASTTLDWVKNYLEKLQMWEHFSTIYGVVI